MGYRSDVHAVFYTQKREDWPLLKLFVEENFPMDELGGCLSEFHGKWHGFHFHSEYVKWYESYSEVQAFDNFVERFVGQIALGVDSSRWCYEFARIGEDYSDIEHAVEGHADNLLEIHRVIATEFLHEDATQA